MVKENFSAVLINDNSELFIYKHGQSFYLNVNKNDLYDFNLMRDYQTKDVNFLLNLMIDKISEHRELFGKNDYMCPWQPYQSPEKAIFICFSRAMDNSDLNAELLNEIFNKYVKSVLSENTLEGAIEQIKSGSVLEKLIMEKRLNKVDFRGKKNKI